MSKKEEVKIENVFLYERMSKKYAHLGQNWVDEMWCKASAAVGNVYLYEKEMEGIYAKAAATAAPIAQTP